MKQEPFKYRGPRTSEPKLFGDYELIVDLALNGDSKLKRRIAEADANDRAGLAVLKNALRNRRVTLPAMLADVIRTCEEDQRYYEELKEDLRNIDKHGPNYRVRLMLAGVRMTKTFTSLRAGQVWRDRMTIFHNQLDDETE
jgi:hypothetical protein